MASRRDGEERGPEVPRIEALPRGMGFGSLDRQSVRMVGGQLTAEYADDGEVVYRVAWGHRGCLLDAYFEGRLVTKSFGADLQTALQYSFLGIGEPAQDPRFVRLAGRVTEPGNVYFRFPARRDAPGSRMIFYPSGLRFVVRQPIVEGNRRAWEAFKGGLDRSGGLEELRPVAERGGAMLHLTTAGELRSEEVTVADLVAPLRTVAEAARRCRAAGLIPSGRAYRLAVMEASDAALGGAQLYLGDREQGELAFAIFPDDPLPDGGPARTREDAADLFLDGVRRLLAGGRDGGEVGRP